MLLAGRAALVTGGILGIGFGIAASLRDAAARVAVTGLTDEEYAAASGPLSFQREYATRLSHWLGQDYPPVAL